MGLSNKAMTDWDGHAALGYEDGHAALGYEDGHAKGLAMGMGARG